MQQTKRLVAGPVGKRVYQPRISGRKCVSHYTVNGKKENKDDKDTIPGTSLKELMLNLPDFKSETTLLQYWAEQIGIKVICSPKYHPEIAKEQSSTAGEYPRTPIEDIH